MARACAVLGAGGFIGTNLCLALGRMGVGVTAAGRRPQRWPAALGEVAWRELEFADSRAVERAVAGQEVVFHLLGGTTPVESNRHPAADIESSLVPSVRLVEACMAAGVRRLVFVSSGGTVYGPAATPLLSESSPTNPITAYGVNKLAVEKYLGVFRHLHGFEAIVLRVANPYGPYQHSRRLQGVVAAMLAAVASGRPIEIWGDGSVVRDYIHIDDVVAALVAAMDGGGSRWLFNIGSGVGRSVREIAEDICRLTDTPLSRIVHRDSRPADVPRNVLDCSLARAELAWTPRVSWAEGLRATAAWALAERGGEQV